MTTDEDLARFAVDGAPRLPEPSESGHVEHDGARIWYATYGAGPAVLLLHGGLGNADNWGHQVSVIIAAGYRVVLVDSRGHGRSTRDARPFAYIRMAADVRAVMDALPLAHAAVVGWSDGAIVALILAMSEPKRVDGVFFFGANMDLSGVKPFPSANPLLAKVFGRHARDYARLSATPDQFEAFAGDVGRMMETEPNYSAADLAAIRVPVTIAYSEHDEFITRDHADYLARSIPAAQFVDLPGVSHFAPLQQPDLFNTAVLAFLERVTRPDRNAP